MVKRQELGQFGIFRQLEITLKKLPALLFRPARFQVHQQKGDFRGHIAAAKLRAEFDAIEDLDALGGETDVLAVEVPVDLANASLGGASVHQLRILV